MCIRDRYTTEHILCLLNSFGVVFLLIHAVLLAGMIKNRDLGVLCRKSLLQSPHCPVCLELSQRIMPNLGQRPFIHFPQLSP